MKRFALLLLCLLVPVLGGWTVISRADLAKIYDNGKQPAMNAVEILDGGIRPYALKKAAPVLSVLENMEGDFDKACADFGFRHSATAFPCNFWLEIRGTIVKIDNKSQSGRAWVLPEGVAADPADEEEGTVVLMIGPAIDSMGPRDGYPELKYSQFNDQTMFGSFGREINRLLSEYIRKKIDPLEKGSVVDVIGVLTAWDAPYDTPEIVPVLFR